MPKRKGWWGERQRHRLAAMGIKTGKKDKLYLWKRTPLTSYERKVMDVMHRAHRPLTTKQIAYYGEMEWITAKNNLRLLESRGKVRSVKKANKIWWHRR